MLNIYSSKIFFDDESHFKTLRSNLQIVWGLAIGCNKKPFLNVTLSEAEIAATFVRDNGLKGISLW